MASRDGSRSKSVGSMVVGMPSPKTSASANFSRSGGSWRSMNSSMTMHAMDSDRPFLSSRGSPKQGLTQSFAASYKFQNGAFGKPIVTFCDTNTSSLATTAILSPSRMAAKGASVDRYLEWGPNPLNNIKPSTANAMLGIRKRHTKSSQSSTRSFGGMAKSGSEPSFRAMTAPTSPMCMSSGRSGGDGLTDLGSTVSPAVADELALLAAAAQSPTSRQSRKTSTPYVDCTSLKAALEKQDTVLIRGSWLVDFCENDGGKLPRRQDIPPEAIWGADELFPYPGTEISGGKEIVSISHCWSTTHHPDPDGFQLTNLVKFIKEWVVVQHGLISDRIAFFLDWCSMPQEPRTTQDQRMFDRALQQVGLWFTHPVPHVWCLTKVPDGITPYEERGWPQFEALVSSLVGRPKSSVLDLGRRESGARHYERGWPTSLDAMNTLIESNMSRFDNSTQYACVAPRQAPLTPKAFKKMLLQKQFANRSDIPMLVEFYEETFALLASTSEKLDYSGLGWEDTDATCLAEALPSFRILKYLNLSNNQIGDFGTSAIADVLPQCPTLKKLFLIDNPIERGLEGPERLCEAWRATGKDDRWLWFSYPLYSDYIKQKLAKPLPEEKT